MSEKIHLETTGVFQWGEISPRKNPFDPQVRMLCQGNVCGNYGTTWACPPAVGSLEECKKQCCSYSHAIVFNGVYPLEDSFDFESMKLGHKRFKEVCDRVYEVAKDSLSDFLLLSNEGCIRCKTCTYPQAPCRFPQMLFPSIEGYGIHVGQLAKAAGIRYINGANTVTYFGMLLYGKID
ncbi:MAG: DUF2284 domain-containing protein [Massiliimalia sp.]|jgi:predicted metal-binding protein